MNEAEEFSLSNDLTEVVNGKDTRSHKMVVMRLKGMTLKDIGIEFGRSSQAIRIALWKIFESSRERSISWQDANTFHKNHFSSSEIEKLKVAARYLSNKQPIIRNVNLYRALLIGGEFDLIKMDVTLEGGDMPICSEITKESKSTGSDISEAGIVELVYKIQCKTDDGLLIYEFTGCRKIQNETKAAS